MIEEKKKDLRIIKTQKLLKESLLELFKTHSFNDITVTEICEKSMINRVTFYDHYNNKEELLNSIIEDIKEDIIKDAKYLHLIKLIFFFIYNIYIISYFYMLFRIY